MLHILCPPQNNFEILKCYIPNTQHAHTIAKINTHDRLAGAIGIIPPLLIRFLHDTCPQTAIHIISDLRRSTLWGTYKIWKKRQELTKIHWKERTPNVVKIRKKKSTQPLTRKRKRQKALQFEACKNPFHYLTLQNPGKIPEFTCPCEYQIHYRSKNPENRPCKQKKTQQPPFKQPLIQQSIQLQIKREVTKNQNEKNRKRNVDNSGLDLNTHRIYRMFQEFHNRTRPVDK